MLAAKAVTKLETYGNYNIGHASKVRNRAEERRAVSHCDKRVENYMEKNENGILVVLSSTTKVYKVEL